MWFLCANMTTNSDLNADSITATDGYCSDLIPLGIDISDLDFTQEETGF